MALKIKCGSIDEVFICAWVFLRKIPKKDLQLDKFGFRYQIQNKAIIEQIGEFCKHIN